MFRNREVPGSNLLLNAWYSEGFRRSPQSGQANSRSVPLIRPQQLPYSSNIRQSLNKHLKCPMHWDTAITCAQKAWLRQSNHSAVFLGPLTKAGLPTGGLHLPYAVYRPAQGGVLILQGSSATRLLTDGSRRAIPSATAWGKVCLVEVNFCCEPVSS